MDKLNYILNNLGLYINHSKSEWMESFPPLKMRRWTDDSYKKYTEIQLDNHRPKNINQGGAGIFLFHIDC